MSDTTLTTPTDYLQFLIQTISIAVSLIYKVTLYNVRSCLALSPHIDPQLENGKHIAHSRAHHSSYLSVSVPKPWQKQLIYGLGPAIHVMILMVIRSCELRVSGCSKGWSCRSDCFSCDSWSVGDNWAFGPGVRQRPGSMGGHRVWPRT